VPQRYAKLAFTAWDWGTSDLSAADDLKATVAQNFEVLKLEDEMDERIRARSQAEWNRLYTMRAVGLSVNSILLLAGATTIIIVTFNSQVAPGPCFRGACRAPRKFPLPPALPCTPARTCWHLLASFPGAWLLRSLPPTLCTQLLLRG
jgi:hypothetical protein